MIKTSNWIDQLMNCEPTWATREGKRQYFPLPVRSGGCASSRIIEQCRWVFSGVNFSGVNPDGGRIANCEDARMEPSAAGKRLLPWLVAVAFFMESLDTTILNTAVPTVATALHVAPLSMKSVLSSYTLSLAVFIPISGWMADRFGTRRVSGSAIGLFTLGSVLCGLSNNIHMLVACRILQGCGGAMMVPVGRLTIVRTFAKSELVRAMSFVAIPGLVGPMLGPIAGGPTLAPEPGGHYSLPRRPGVATSDPVGLRGPALNSTRSLHPSTTGLPSQERNH